MCNYLRQFRRPLTFAATLLIAVAYWHCAWEWAAELQHQVALKGAATPSPASPMQGCENESGCICQGATVAVPLDAGCLAADDMRSIMVCLPAADENVVSVPALCGLDSAPWQRPVLPFSGRQLRALYASLLI